MIKKANDYLKNTDYPQTYKNKFHFDVPTGWMNDPNGCIKAFGKYHIFYQHYPYEAKQGLMHWGHVATEDFINWENLPVALAPDHDYDKDGCWSGSAFMHDGLLWLMYTGCCDGKQQQCLAYSSDGITFEKYEENPVIRTEQLPPNSIYYSFRDPYVVQKNGMFYVLLGGRDIKHNKGRVMLYRSEDLTNWIFVNDIITGNDMVDPGIYECPNIATVSGKDIFISSLNFTPNQGELFRNFANPIYHVGSLDYETGTYQCSKQKLLDYGFDFYAPQFISSDEEHKILISWLQMWEQTYPTEKYGWVGSLGLPRKISLVGETITTYPALDFEKFFKKTETYVLGLGSIESQIKLQDRLYVLKNYFNKNLETTLVKLNFDDGCYLEIKIDQESKKIILSRKNTKFIPNSKTTLVDNLTERIYPYEKVDSLEIWLDQSIIEIYVNDGEAVLSSNFYCDGENVTVEYQSTGQTLVDLDIYKFKKGGE